MPNATALRRCVLLPLLLIALQSAFADGLWVKGNTHAHSTLSDGNVPPEGVAKWYRDHGYGFVVLTDHNTQAPAAFFTANSDDQFVVLPGEEVTTSGPDNAFAVHLNAIGLDGAIAAVNPPAAADKVRENFDRIRSAGALPQLNHPSFYMRSKEAVAGLEGPFLIEVYNNGVARSAVGKIVGAIFEAAWDGALTAGRTAWGVASDDTHNYSAKPSDIDGPGGGWVMVHVAKLTRADIIKSLTAGDFYASTGVDIAKWSRDGKTVRVAVKPVAGLAHTIQFVGRAGKVLSTTQGTSAEYTLTGSPDEMYVRARIKASDESAAWTQPILPGK